MKLNIIVSRLQALEKDPGNQGAGTALCIAANRDRSLSLWGAPCLRLNVY